MLDKIVLENRVQVLILSFGRIGRVANAAAVENSQHVRSDLPPGSQEFGLWPIRQQGFRVGVAFDVHLWNQRRQKVYRICQFSNTPDEAGHYP